MSTVLLWWIVVACTVFVIACAWRAVKYARAPEHLRWDLYPVAHEPASRRSHGGSYLEERDWWTKPRTRSHLGEILAMAEEIFLLRGVWHNHRRLWWGSLPFHWGLYVLLLTTAALVPALVGVAPSWWTIALAVGGVAGGALTAVGAFTLLWLRSTSPRLRPYTSIADRLNLLLLVALGGLSVAVAAAPGGMNRVVGAVGSIVRGRPPEVTWALGLQMGVAALFLFYLPFTRMIHFFSKYFTYHQVRWDDRPVVAGSALERRLRGALDFGVDWSAEHLRTGKTWAEIATTLPEPKKGE